MRGYSSPPPKLIAHEDAGEQLEIVFLEGGLALGGVVLLFPCVAFGVYLPIFTAQSAHDAKLAERHRERGVERVDVAVVDEAVEIRLVFAQVTTVPVVGYEGLLRGVLVSVAIGQPRDDKGTRLIGDATFEQFLFACA